MAWYSWKNPSLTWIPVESRRYWEYRYDLWWCYRIFPVITWTWKLLLWKRNFTTSVLKHYKEENTKDFIRDMTPWSSSRSISRMSLYSASIMDDWLEMLMFLPSCFLFLICKTMPSSQWNLRPVSVQKEQIGTSDRFCLHMYDLFGGGHAAKLVPISLQKWFDFHYIVLDDRPEIAFV